MHKNYYSPCSFIVFTFILLSVLTGCKSNSTETTSTGGSQYKIAYVSYLGNSDVGIFVMNADSTNRKRLTSNSIVALYPSWSPDGRKIVFVVHASTGYTVNVMNADGTNQMLLATGAGDDWDERPIWSPDGGKIVYRGSGGITIINSDGSNSQVISGGTSPAWSNDGSKIAFMNSVIISSFVQEIFVMDADGANKKQLTNDSLNKGAVCWSPNGNKIAFVLRQEGKYYVYAMNADGTDQTRLTNDSEQVRFPSWSPDGLKIAFVSNRNGSAEVIVMQSDGSNRHQVTNIMNTGFSDYFPPGYALWSPDGTKLLFVSYGSNENGIGIVNADGTKQLRLSSAWDLYPVWSPVPIIE